VVWAERGHSLSSEHVASTSRRSASTIQIVHSVSDPDYSFTRLPSSICSPSEEMVEQQGGDVQAGRGSQFAFPRLE